MGNQIIKTVVNGPILSNGDAITVTASGGINGGPSGVSAENFSITTLSNYGFIDGEAFSMGAGGQGVNNLQTINLLFNAGKIRGGEGAGSTSPGVSAISNFGKITTLTNTGTITGGEGVDGANGGTGIADVGEIGSAGVRGSGLHNSGSILGGNAVSGTFLTAAFGGAGVFNFGTITSLTNAGTIIGGAGAHSGHGGTGIFNQGVITALSSSRKITGGAGGNIGPGGVGLLNSFTAVLGGNSGTISTLTASGVISGGAGGGFVGAGGAGGDGLVNAVKSTIDELQVYAHGTILGGAGGQGGASRFRSAWEPTAASASRTKARSPR
jgi:fibronectin-binding autotransporter adhesin